MSMSFYIMNLDHHGDYQGIYHKFDTEKQSKSYLDTKTDTIRMGRIGYSTFSGRPLLSAIIFQSTETHVTCNGSEYDVEEGSVFDKDITKTLQFVAKYKNIISDSIYDE